MPPSSGTHVPRAPHQSTAVQEVCRDFQNYGRCNWGNNCRRLHTRVTNQVMNDGAMATIDFVRAPSSDASSTIREEYSVRLPTRPSTTPNPGANPSSETGASRISSAMTASQPLSHPKKMAREPSPCSETSLSTADDSVRSLPSSTSSINSADKRVALPPGICRAYFIASCTRDPCPFYHSKGPFTEGLLQSIVHVRISIPSNVCRDYYFGQCKSAICHRVHTRKFGTNMQPTAKEEEKERVEAIPVSLPRPRKGTPDSSSSKQTLVSVPSKKGEVPSHDQRAVRQRPLPETRIIPSAALAGLGSLKPATECHFCRLRMCDGNHGNHSIYIPNHSSATSEPKLNSRDVFNSLVAVHTPVEASSKAPWLAPKIGLSTNSGQSHVTDKPEQLDPTINASQRQVRPSMAPAHDLTVPKQGETSPSNSKAVTSSTASPPLRQNIARSSNIPSSLSDTRILPSRPDNIKLNVLDTTWVEFRSGFEVINVTTAFETRWIALTNVPSSTSVRSLEGVVKRFGEVKSVIGLGDLDAGEKGSTNKPTESSSWSATKNKGVGSSTATTMVKVQFGSTDSAAAAAAALHGARAFKQTIAARPLHQGVLRRTGTLDNLTIRLSWPLPGRHALVGYASEEVAQRVVREVNQTTLRDFPLSARIYTGVPTLGRANVRIEGLPVDVREEEIKAFGKKSGGTLAKEVRLEGLLLERQTNYTSVEDSVRSITTAIESACPGQLLTLDVLPPPYRESTLPHHKQRFDAHNRFGSPIKRERMLRAYAHFLSPSAAAAACISLNGHRQPFLGGDRLWAAHVQSVFYRVPIDVMNMLRLEITELARAAWLFGGRTNVQILDGRGPHGEQRNCQHQRSVSAPVLSNFVARNDPGVDKPTQTVGVRLSGESVASMARLKTIFERMLRGERVVNAEGQLVWDDYFTSRAGLALIASLRAQYRRTMISLDFRRRFVTLHGHAADRAPVRAAIVAEVQRLGRMRVTTLPLVGRSVDLLLNKEFAGLQREFGRENVRLDPWNRKLEVRGGEMIVSAAKEAIRLTQANIEGEQKRSGSGDGGLGCPVCLDEPRDRTILPCGHAYCCACLKAYLLSASTGTPNSFPLHCIASATPDTTPAPTPPRSGGRTRHHSRTPNKVPTQPPQSHLQSCLQLLPLSLVRMVLSPSEFEAVARCAFDVHVRTHPAEFRYCPSPACEQVFRTPPLAKAGTTMGNANAGAVLMQCPACLTGICPACCGVAHEGSDCPGGSSNTLANRKDTSDGKDTDSEQLFEEWRASHDVKTCPGCRAPIEKNAGCNHIVCAQCRTHICWVCLETFGDGSEQGGVNGGRTVGVYEHMRSVHGGIGTEEEGWN